MRVRVEHTLADLERDLMRSPAKVRAKVATAVGRNARQGSNLARRFAQQASGPHGKSYYKRITAEANSPLDWEYGPEGIPKTEFVGAGYRNGPANNDLEKSMDLAVPRLVRDIGDALKDPL